MFVTGKYRILNLYARVAYKQSLQVVPGDWSANARVIKYKENILPDQKKPEKSQKSGLIVNRTFDVLQ